MEEQAEPQEHPREKTPLQPKFPPKPTFLPQAALHRVGNVVSAVGELLIVEGAGAFVVDLDNWLCGEDKELVGFVMDVLGRVEAPYYAVRPEQGKETAPLVGTTLFYIEGSSRILRDEDIQSMKSRSALEAEEQQDDSDSDDGRIERDFSEEPPRQPQHEEPRRQNKFREEREPQRDRTREQRNRQNSRGRNEHNQRYLESVYSAHYDQMMRLYSGGPQQHYPNNPYQHPMMQYQPQPPQYQQQPPPQQYEQLPQQKQYNEQQRQYPPQQYQQQPPPQQHLPQQQYYGAPAFGGGFQPQTQSVPPQVPNPFAQVTLPTNPVSHANIAHFGSTPAPSFYGQQPPQPQ